MSTTAAVSVDEFQALEEKVVRAVEVLRREREARARAEAERAEAQRERAEAQGEIERLHAEVGRHAETAGHLQSEIDALHGERVEVRRRVEKMLQQMDELL